MWGYVKNIVFAEKFHDLDHLQQRITAAVATVTPDMLHCTWMETEYCLGVCRVTNGAHIKTY
jgi:hypothetical protein